MNDEIRICLDILKLVYTCMHMTFYLMCGPICICTHEHVSGGTERQYVVDVCLGFPSNICLLFFVFSHLRLNLIEEMHQQNAHSNKMFQHLLQI